MNMKELASKWGWNLQADKKNIYVAKTPQMYVSLMKSQVVFFALRSIMDIRHAIDQKNILLKIQPPHGYVVEYPMAEAGKASGVCLKIKIPNKDWSAHNDEVKNIAENLVRVLQENDIWTGKLEDGHEYGKSCEKGDVKKGGKSLPKGCAITHNDPFEGVALDFCPKINTLSVSGISNLIATSVFWFNEDEGKTFRNLLLKRYDQMSNKFLKVGFDDRDEEGNLMWNLDGCQTRLEGCHDARLEVPLKKYGLDNNEANRMMGNAGNFGHDMPVWLCKKGVDFKQCKKVMLVTQDPLRTNDPAGAVYLSTPFSLHCKGYRADGYVLKYTTLISKILERGVAVYATDFKKWYAKKRGYVGDKSFPGIMSQARKILEKEIGLFKPNLIVAAGRDPYAFMRKMMTQTCASAKNHVADVHGQVVGDYKNGSVHSQFMVIIHPSGSAAGHQKAAGITDYPGYYFDKIMAVLDKQNEVGFV